MVSPDTLSGPQAGANNAGLTSEDLAALRESLNEQRLFRREQLRQFAARAGSRPGGGRAPEGPGQGEVRAQLAASARMVLADVEAALARMDAGTYGSCHLCRRPVERERLRIVPQARYCGRCQQVREAVR
ncbi:hypothetical protein HCJ93_18870 [Streptomyces sp. SBST2-5]|uniref:Zinc finger DksA/TraR C4-type domain-containing protein n=1 Tax=Streptomyces composti TaxID=2720025 RepID=A0ABX1A6J1_9ACTN|nr:TraR/DksA C4-type zinc finger protein [Streptomyces composti]NJP52054.1 hypothetical protein [Streptomyces composti]